MGNTPPRAAAVFLAPSGGIAAAAAATAVTVAAADAAATTADAGAPAAPLADATGKTPRTVTVDAATATDSGAPSAHHADAAGKTPLPVTVAAAGATAAAAASITAPPPHVGTSLRKGARDGGYGPVGLIKTRCNGLLDLTFVFLGTARLIAFASPQPSQYPLVSVIFIPICVAVSRA